MLRILIVESGSEFESCFYHLLVMWFKVNQLTSLCSSFLNCKREMVIIPKSTRWSMVSLMCLYCLLSLPCPVNKLGITIPKIPFHVWLWVCQGEVPVWNSPGRSRMAVMFQRRQYKQKCGQEDVSFPVATGWACWESPISERWPTQIAKASWGPPRCAVV